MKDISSIMSMIIVMYRRNEMNEGNESCISDESCSGRKSCAGNGVPTNGGWQWTPTVVGKVRGPREVYIAPIAPIGNQVVLQQRLLHTLLTPRTLVRSAQYLTIYMNSHILKFDFKNIISNISWLFSYNLSEK